MKLTTLGGLGLYGSPFKRELPLLLLAYLTLEGAKSREHLSDLFWQRPSKKTDKKQRLNNLSRVLSDLRKFAPGTFEADSARVWALTEIDVRDIDAAYEAEDYGRVLELYRGPFAEGHLVGWGVELEEWLLNQGATLAERVRQAHLSVAEAAAAKGRFAEASVCAATAFTLEGAAFPEPETLARFHTLLVAGGHPLAAQLRQEALEYGLALALTPTVARGRLRPSFVGREAERARLQGLEPGSWVWLRGGEGMGKSTLMKSLQGTYLPARSSLPYATLDPVLGSSVAGTEQEMLGVLSAQLGPLLLDGWAQTDPESRELLMKLRKLQPETRVVIASETAPPFSADVFLELTPLSPKALAAHPGAWEATGGLPTLVGAYLRGEPLETALETRLSRLTETAQDFYLSLALLNEPALRLVRRALELDAAETARALDDLLAAGLIERSGQTRAKATTRAFLETHPTRTAPLALALARELEPLDAYLLYRQVPALWTAADKPKVTEAYLAWASELLRRGFPQQASEVLKDAPPGDEVTFARARALERAENFREALALIQTLGETPDLLALKGALYWRLGEHEQARVASERALEGGMETRAEANNTLGNLERSQGNYQQALKFTQRAEALWSALGNEERQVGSLNNLAITETLLGREAEATFRKALDVASENPALQAKTLLNLGWMYERQRQNSLAEDVYRRAVVAAELAGATATAARIQNNLGVLFHKQEQVDRAQKEYEKALVLARQAGDQRILGMAMANLAELNLVYEAWQEALYILETSGHEDAAQTCRTGLLASHPFRQHRNGD